MPSDNPVKVSVAIITYNHGEFIAKTLDSVLMQEVNFDYEIIIGEDCSTDNTRKIILEYQKKYPDRFRLFLNKTNLGAHKNAAQVQQACKGLYVAVLEGDDYWTSPDKLQKQVDFLDSHPECAICFHNVKIIYTDGSEESRTHCPLDQKEITTLEDLLIRDYIPTCSTMYKRGLFGELPNWLTKVRCGDWALHSLNAQYGDIGYINEIMGVYVKHPGGIWSSFRKNNELEHDKAIIEYYDAMSANLDQKYRRSINRILPPKLLDLTMKCEKAGDLAGAKIYGLRCLKNHFIFKKWLLKMLFELYYPGMFNMLRTVKRKFYPVRHGSSK